MKSTEKQLWLPEHSSNPFIRRLGAVKSPEQQFEVFERVPHNHPSERLWPAHLRRHCVMRLYDWIQPADKQLDLFDRIDMAMRQGYKMRNPVDGGYTRRILSAAVRREDRASKRELKSLLSEEAGLGSGFGFVGYPGMGKSMSLRRILASYPEIVRHDSRRYGSIVQVPTLMIDAPTRGSKRQFCLKFIKTLGLRVGEDYVRAYVKNRPSTDELVGIVETLAQVHALGILVVDEVQHLRQAKEKGDLINFLVTLVNELGLPVVMTGTMSAVEIFQEDVREGRRAVGLGTPVWEPLKWGAEWDDFVREMWTYQWTSSPTPLDEPISRVLYEESQGISDLAVKLYMCAQYRSISIGEGGGDETISAERIATVARDEFKVVEPMIRAIATGDLGLLAKYDDLKPLHKHLNAAFQRPVGLSARDIRERREAEGDGGSEIGGLDEDCRLLRSLLVRKGHAEAEVERLVIEARGALPNADLLELGERVRKGLAKGGRKNGKAVAKNERKRAPGDLRDILLEGADDAEPADLLEGAGVISGVADAFASD